MKITHSTLRCAFVAALSIVASSALACDPISTLRDMKDANAGTRIQGVQCVASLKQPSVEIVMRLVELFSDETRGPSRVGILDGVLADTMFPGQRAYAEQVDYHAKEASDEIPLNVQYIEPLLKIIGKTPNEKARQIEARLMERFAFGGYRTEIVQGLTRIIKRDPKEDDGCKKMGGGWSVCSGKSSLDGIAKESYQLQFLLDRIKDDSKYASQVLERSISDDSVTGLALNAYTSPLPSSDTRLIKAQTMQEALTMLENSKNVNYIGSIASAWKFNRLSAAMALPVLQRMGNQKLETADEWLKWLKDKRELNQAQRAMFKNGINYGAISGDAPYAKWVASPNGRTAEAAAALFNERNALIMTGGTVQFGDKETQATMRADAKQRELNAKNDPVFMGSARAFSFTLLASSSSSPIALLSSEGTSFSELGNNYSNVGNTRCDQRLPVACVSPQAALTWHTFWDGDVTPPTVKLTPPVVGTTMTTYDAGNAMCATQFGNDWQMLGEEDAKLTAGNLPAAMVNTKMAPGTRFWIKAGKSRVRTAFCNVSSPASAANALTTPNAKQPTTPLTPAVWQAAPALTEPTVAIVAKPTPLNCLNFTSNGQGPGSSRFIAHNGATLGSLGSIGSITGRIWGATSSDGSLRTINLTANSVWQGQGYQSSGPTGGWQTLMVGTAPSYVDAIDLRFGTKDGIHPGKEVVPQGTDSLYVVQRNTKNPDVRINIQGFELTVCGAVK